MVQGKSWIVKNDSYLKKINELVALFYDIYLYLINFQQFKNYFLPKFLNHIYKNKALQAITFFTI